jgi:hypothetical protein
MRNILGSVSGEIVHKAPCTVTVVRKSRAAMKAEASVSAAASTPAYEREAL